MGAREVCETQLSLRVDARRLSTIVPFRGPTRPPRPTCEFVGNDRRELRFEAHSGCGWKRVAGVLIARKKGPDADLVAWEELGVAMASSSALVNF